MKKLLAVLLAGIMAFSIVGCGSQTTTTTAQTNEVATATEESQTQQTVADTATQPDTEGDSVRLEDDFYEYINADTLAQHEIPSTERSWSWFDDLDDAVEEDLDNIIDNLVSDGKDYDKGTAQQKIKDLYECISNSENRDAVGYDPLRENLDSIRNASDIEEFTDALEMLNITYGFYNLGCSFSVSVDDMDSDQYIVVIEGAETLLGKAYLEGEDTQDYVTKYLEYMKKLYMAYGMDEDEADNATQNVESLWRQICSASLTTEQYYDPSLTYNVFSEDELQALYSNIDIPKMLKTLGIDGQEKYKVTDVGQAEMLNSLWVEDNLQALKDYVTFVTLSDAAYYSSTDVEKLYLEFYNYLYGIESEADDKRWKELEESLLSWYFAEIYVEEHFSEEDRDTVREMIDQIIDQYAVIIDNQDWLSDDTKANAKKKLETLDVRIAYPDEWPKFKGFDQITPISEGGSLLSNYLDAGKAYVEYMLGLIGKEVDKSVWPDTPQTINAFYEPSGNSITISLGIMQAPFYDSSYSYAQNMGGIGFVIGHEISHAFDSDGSLYDENGVYNDWWTEEEREKYEELSQSIIDYYNDYEVMGMNVNGTLTLGENIADLGSLTCIVSILTTDEELEEAFGQMAIAWASKFNTEYQTYLINNDTHSPDKVRINATLSSCDAFYRVFDIKEGDGMYVAPEDRIGIWK